ncbi:hypothetical protein Aperf_G00000016069 [Anoplocephala perfoliata]
MELQLRQAKLRLIYFNFRGRGELIRLILHAAEKDFEDHRVTLIEWPILKPKMPYKKMPVLEVTPPGGEKVMLTESLAIVRLLARTFDLYGNDAREIYLIERMSSLITTLMEEIYAFQLKDPKNFAKIVTSEHLFEFFDAIEMALKERKGNFILGNRVSVADIHVIFLVDTIQKFTPNLKHGCISKLIELKENVLKQKPGIERYLRSRPDTDF